MFRCRWYAAFHNITAVVGAGVLGLPYAMKVCNFGIQQFFSPTTHTRTDTHTLRLFTCPLSLYRCKKFCNA